MRVSITIYYDTATTLLIPPPCARGTSPLPLGVLLARLLRRLFSRRGASRTRPPRRRRPRNASPPVSSQPSPWRAEVYTEHRGDAPASNDASPGDKAETQAGATTSAPSPPRAKAPTPRIYRVASSFPATRETATGEQCSASPSCQRFFPRRACRATRIRRTPSPPPRDTQTAHSSTATPPTISASAVDPKPRGSAGVVAKSATGARARCRGDARVPHGGDASRAATTRSPYVASENRDRGGAGAAAPAREKSSGEKSLRGASKRPGRPGASPGRRRPGASPSAPEPRATAQSFGAPEPRSARRERAVAGGAVRHLPPRYRERVHAERRRRRVVGAAAPARVTGAPAVDRHVAVHERDLRRLRGGADVEEAHDGGVS